MYYCVDLIVRVAFVIRYLVALCKLCSMMCSGRNVDSVSFVKPYFPVEALLHVLSPKWKVDGVAASIVFKVKAECCRLLRTVYVDQKYDVIILPRFSRNLVSDTPPARNDVFLRDAIR